jgi:hypothetical protein
MVSAWRADIKDILPADTINVFCSSACCPLTVARLELLPALSARWWWWATAGPRVMSEMSGSKEKIDVSDYHGRESYAVES